jgi:3-oxoacyl-[acyl-carrier-protein] synthase-3
MNKKNVYITASSSFLPNKPITNDEMESILGYVAGKPSRARRIVLKQNKITTRYYSLDPSTRLPVYTNYQLSAHAIRGLLNDAFSLDDITCLVTGTSLVEHLMPNHGVMVHGELGGPVCEVVSVAGVCVAGATALKYGYLSALSGEHDSVVVSASEMLSASLKSENYDPEIEERIARLEEKPILAFEKDFLRWMLSDGAGALLLRTEPKSQGVSLKIEWMDLFSFANELDVCMYCGAEKGEDGALKGWALYEPEERNARSLMSIQQDVKLLNENMVKYSIRAFESSFIKRGYRCEEIDYFLPHISSYYFKDLTHKGLSEKGYRIPEEKWFMNLSSVGNVGAASIYLMLDELLRTRDLQDGQKILCFVPESGRFSYCCFMLSVVKK